MTDNRLTQKEKHMTVNASPYSRPVKLDCSADGAVVIREAGKIHDGFLPLFSTNTNEEAQALRTRYCRKERDSGLYRLNDFGGELEDLADATETLRVTYEHDQQERLGER